VEKCEVYWTIYPPLKNLNEHVHTCILDNPLHTEQHVCSCGDKAPVIIKGNTGSAVLTTQELLAKRIKGE